VLSGYGESRPPGGRGRPDFSVRYGTWAGSGLLGAEAEKDQAKEAGPEEQASAQCGDPDLTSTFVCNFVFAYI